MHLATIVANVVKVPGLSAVSRRSGAASASWLAKPRSHTSPSPASGGDDAHPRTIRKLAQALGVQPAELMGEWQA